MKTEPYTLPSAQLLTEAYTHQTDAQLAHIFGYYPGNEQDWHKRLASLQQEERLRAPKDKLAEVLREYNRNLMAGDAAMHAIDLIAEGAPVIVGGQQAGLWTGPLLVIHKAVSIVGAAKKASDLLGKRVVPVFWIAGEDHDWDEVNHTYLISAEQELKKLTIARSAEPRTSVSRTIITAEQWAEQLQNLDQALPGSEFKEELMQRLEEMAERSHSLSDMFANIMSHLFRDEGLVMMDADYSGIRQLESSMFAWMINQNDELEHAYAAAARQVGELGYPLQAELSEGSMNLFMFHPELNGERVLLYKQEERIADRKGRFELTKEQLLQVAKETPELLSNNVLTRPLMQQFLFPVLGTVLGPGEIAYWAITAEAFRKAGMELPIIVPRSSFTLVEGIVAKNMAKYELSFEDVLERFEERKAAWLKEQDNLNLAEQFERVKEQFKSSYEPIINTAASIQPGLAKLGDTNMSKILEQITYMEQKTIDAHNKQYEASVRQLDRIRLSIMPSGKLQERMLTMAGYWNRYGEEWLQELLEQPYDLCGGHQIAYL